MTSEPFATASTWTTSSGGAGAVALREGEAVHAASVLNSTAWLRTPRIMQRGSAGSKGPGRLAAFVLVLHLLVGVVGVHVGAARAVPLSEADAVARAIGVAVERHSGRRVEVDRPDWEQCGAPGPCVATVRARLRADEVLLLSVVGGPLQLFVRAQLVGEDGAPKEASAKVPREDAEQPEAWLELASTLFAAREVTAPPVALTTTATPASPYPWIAGGVGAAALGGGIVFGALTRSTVSDIEDRAHTPERRAELDSRASTQAAVANVCFGVAVTAGITALVLWLVD